MMEQSFTVKAMMNLQKSISEVSTKAERLIKDVKSQGSKLDVLINKISFVQGQRG